MVYFQCYKEWKGNHSEMCSWTFCLHTRRFQELKRCRGAKKDHPRGGSNTVSLPPSFSCAGMSEREEGMLLLLLLEKCRRRNACSSSSYFFFFQTSAERNVYSLWSQILYLMKSISSFLTSFRKTRRTEKPMKECAFLLACVLTSCLFTSRCQGGASNPAAAFSNIFSTSSSILGYLV